MADVFCEEYASSLNDLTCNSKPHISVLTMLAEENSQYAPNVVRLIEQHLQKVRPEIKLPAIYLIDSIVKNVRGEYLSLFTQNLVSTFCSVFEKVDEKTRLQLYKLRQTWADVFPNKKLYAIDMRVNQMDPAWPINAPPNPNPTIHVNPKFLKSPKEEEPTSVKANQEIEEAEMRRQLIAKQQELLKLQQQKLELELLQAKARLEEQKRLLQTQQNEVEQTVQETNKLPVTTPVTTPILPQIQTNNVMMKDPRNAKLARTTKDNKPFRIPNLSSAVTKPINNFVSSKSMDSQIKSEVKQNASGVMKQERNMSDLASGTFFAKQTLACKDQTARNETIKGLKKKDSTDLPSSKVSSKKKSEREWKKSKNDQIELKKTIDSQSPNKKCADIKSDALSGKRKEKSCDKKSKKDTRDGSKVRKGERKNVVNANKSGLLKKDHDANKKNDNLSRRTNFRSRRNYRSNRDRSESPELKLDQANSSPKLNLDGSSSSDSKRADERPRSPSMTRKDGKYKKKMGDVIGEKVKNTPIDESKENKMDSADVLMTDVDLRHSKVKRDVNEDVEEILPPSKRNRRDDDKDSRMTNLFGSKDQDYRQICQSEKNQMRNDRNSWAQYKAEHPEEFKNSPFPPRGNRPDFIPFRSYDMDLRNMREFDPDVNQSGDGLLNPPGTSTDRMRNNNNNNNNMRGGRSSDPRLLRRGFGRPMRQGNNNNNNNNNRVFDDTRNLRRHPLYERYQMEFESNHPSVEIPNALLLDKQGEIMRQADQQLKSGQLTREQHHELLNQLGKLYELQVTREKQREEQLRERIMSNRPSLDESNRRDFSSEFDNKNSFASTNRLNLPPETSETATINTATNTTTISCLSSESRVANPEPESGARTKVSMLSIFQRENSASTSSDNCNPNKIAVAADDGDRLIAIDGKIMKLKYYNGTAIILEGNKVQEILFRGTRREIFVDREIVLLGFEGDEQTFYLNSKPHTLKFGTPTHEIYIDKIPYEARFGGPPIRVLLDGDVHEIRMGGPPPDVELKELGADMKVQIAHLIDDVKEATSSQTVDEKKEKVNEEKKNEEEDNDVDQSIPMDIDDLNDNETMPLDGDDPKDSENEKKENVEVEKEDKDSARMSPVHEDRFESRPERQGTWDKEREQHRGYEKENFSEQFTSHDYRDKGRDKWREREKPMRNVREYNTARQIDDRDEYWQRREDDFGRRPKYYRERGGRNASPQRTMNEYGRFRDAPRRNFNPMYFSEGPRMRYDGARSPYDSRSRGYDVNPRFEMRPRTDLRHPAIRQPLLGQYYGANQFNQFYPDEQKYGTKNNNSDTNMSAQSSLLPFAVPSQTAATVPSLDVSELFQKLVANGIIPSTITAAVAAAAASSSTTITTTNAEVAADTSNKVESVNPVPEEPAALVVEEEDYFEEYDEKVPTIEFTSESLRTRYPGVIGKLCRGIQCSSCGLRFTAEQTEKYAQHLDWHFRQNRRERDSAKKAMSRKWYYDVQDWIQFEEIEDMEERARSLFEEQASEEQTDQIEDVQSIPVAEDDDDNICAVCGESFEQFWDQDREEWHLRDATRVDGKTYHPICYEDIRNIAHVDTPIEDVKDEPKQIIADSWKSLEEKLEEENKLKMAVKEEKENETMIKEEPMDTNDVAVASEMDSDKELTERVSVKQEPQSPMRDDVNEMESEDVNLTRDDGKASIDIGQEEKIEQDKELYIKEELIDNRMESISSHLIDNVELDVKLNEDKRNVDENLVCPVKTDEVVETQPPTSRPMESQRHDGDKNDDDVDDDGMVEYVPPKLPGFTILPPQMRGTELSGLCSIM